MIVFLIYLTNQNLNYEKFKHTKREPPHFASANVQPNYEIRNILFAFSQIHFFLT